MSPKGFGKNTTGGKPRGNVHTMVMGDPRTSGFATTNDDLKNFFEEEATIDGRMPLEIDREYNQAMQKVEP